MLFTPLMQYSDASLIQNINLYSHLFGKQFTFITIKCFIYPDDQLGNVGVQISEAPLDLSNACLLFYTNKVEDGSLFGLHIKIKWPCITSTTGKVDCSHFIKTDMEGRFVNKDEPSF